MSVVIVSTKRKWTLSKMLFGERVRSDGRTRRRRRLWSADEKRRIVAESLEPGASVALVARRHDLNANMLFTWRREAGVAVPATETMTLVPATIRSAAAGVASVAASSPRSCRIEIILRSGERLIVGADVDVEALARVIKVLALR